MVIGMNLANVGFCRMVFWSILKIKGLSLKKNTGNFILVEKDKSLLEISIKESITESKTKKPCTQQSALAIAGPELEQWAKE